MDDLLKALTKWLADAPRRERDAADRHKELVETIRDGFILISHTLQDSSARR
jgi:hypothetical protein